MNLCLPYYKQFHRIIHDTATVQMQTKNAELSHIAICISWHFEHQHLRQNIDLDFESQARAV